MVSQPSTNALTPNACIQIDGPTQRNTQGFKFSQVSETADSTREKRYLPFTITTLVCIASAYWRYLLFLSPAETKEGKLPDQKNDPVLAAFYSLQSDGQEPDNTYLPGVHAGLILVHPIDDPGSFPSYLQHPIEPIVVDSELELITALVDLVRRWDPDILAGWEVQSASWGYVGARMAVYAQGSSFS
jgi:DNA polymerase zeta